MTATTYIPGSIGRLVYNAQWLPANATDAQKTAFLDVAIAIALAESGGVSNRVSATGDYGVWQINKRAHADLFTKYKWDYGPDNAKMAKSVYEKAGNSWTPWVTYNSGAYKKFLGHGAASLADIKGDKPQSGSGIGELINPDVYVKGAKDAVGGFKDGATSVAEKLNPVKALGKVLEFLRDAGIVVGAFILAVILFILGAIFLLSETKAGKLAVGIGSKGIIPTGKAEAPKSVEPHLNIPVG